MDAPLFSQVKRWEYSSLYFVIMDMRSEVWQILSILKDCVSGIGEIYIFYTFYIQSISDIAWDNYITQLPYAREICVAHAINSVNDIDV